jgi:hypothetical protein
LIGLAAVSHVSASKKAEVGGQSREMEFSRFAYLIVFQDLRTGSLRQAIHAREGGVCFDCLRRTPSRAHCLDHVVPLVEGGSNSYRNLVSCCMGCNSEKRGHAAADFLRRLYREGRLSKEDLNERLSTVQDLAGGKLRPRVFSGENAGSEGGTKNKGAREGTAPTGAEARRPHRPVIL